MAAAAAAARAARRGRGAVAPRGGGGLGGGLGGPGGARPRRAPARAAARRRGEERRWWQQKHLKPIAAAAGFDFSDSESESDSESAVDSSFVRSVPLFATLDDRAVELVRSRLYVADFQAGENIVTQGNVGERFYMLMEGEAFAFREDKGGENSPLMRYRKGGYFGEIALITDRRRGATVRASSPVRAAYLLKEDFKQLPKATRRALTDRMVIYDASKGISVQLRNDAMGAKGLTRLTISTVAVDFDQGALLAKIIAEMTTFGMRLFNASVSTDRATGKVVDTFDILREDGTQVPESSFDALRQVIVLLLNPRKTSRSTMPAIFGKLPGSDQIMEPPPVSTKEQEEGPITREAAQIDAQLAESVIGTISESERTAGVLKDQIMVAEDLIRSADDEGAAVVKERRELKERADQARTALAAADMALAELNSVQAQVNEAVEAGALQDEIEALTGQLEFAELNLSAQQVASDEAAAALQRLIKGIEVSKIAAAAAQEAPALPLELLEPPVAPPPPEAPPVGFQQEAVEVEEEAPAYQATGTGYEILLQAFNWESWRGNYYDNLRGSVKEIAGQGVTAMWLPPPSQSVSDQGYLPGDLWNLNSEYGSEQSLRDCLNTVRDEGIIPLADIVVNHRCAQGQDSQGRWNQYHGRMNWGTWAITADSGMFGGTGRAKEEENFTAAPNLDHTNDTVRRDISEWLNYLRSDVGYEGWRFDYVKGYPGKYTGEYIANTHPAPKMVVGEFWDTCSYTEGVLDYNQNAHRQRTINWIDSTGGRSGAFDFTTKAVLQEAIGRREYWRLIDPAGRPPGVLGFWPSRAVTFIDNHDTGSTLNHWPFPSHGIAQGYAYILTHPGTPTVFTDHLYDGNLRGGILALMDLRKKLRIHSRSSVKILGVDAEHYAAMIDGGALIVKIGPGDFSPHMDERAREVSNKWDIAASGDEWCVWVQN